MGSQRAGGPWMDSEVGDHINLLELKAVGLALQSFVSNQKNKHILIRMDNRVAIAYVNAKGGTRSKALNQEALEIWGWCLKRNLTIQAEHVPGILNTEADFESRHSQDPSDWMLQPSLFATIQALRGPLHWDLFAARHNCQLPHYYSWRPDPNSSGVNAFLHSWNHLQAYAFLPFCLVGKCLNKVSSESSETSHCHSPLEGTSVVSTVTRNVSGGSATPPLSPRSSGGPPGASTSNDTVRTATSSRVDSLLQQYQSQGVL